MDYIRTLPSHQYNLECCKKFWAKILSLFVLYTPTCSLSYPFSYLYNSIYSYKEDKEDKRAKLQVGVVL